MKGFLFGVLLALAGCAIMDRLTDEHVDDQMVERDKPWFVIAPPAAPEPLKERECTCP